MIKGTCLPKPAAQKSRTRPRDTRKLAPERSLHDANANRQQNKEKH